MKFGKVLLCLMVLIVLTRSANAEGGLRFHPLSPGDINRLRAVKVLLDGVDGKSLQETVHEIEMTKQPQLNIQMKEAMAKAYADIVRDINVEGKKKKEWLYSMVCLNMAYLQFGGSQGAPGSTSELNRLIRQKLKFYLPAYTLKQLGMMFSLE